MIHMSMKLHLVKSPIVVALGRPLKFGITGDLLATSRRGGGHIAGHIINK